MFAQPAQRLSQELPLQSHQWGTNSSAGHLGFANGGLTLDAGSKISQELPVGRLVENGVRFSIGRA
ncbi:MAG: hypothetical protein CMI17_09525 [Opitutaceae bacterium]|nr:hypothetical protein [Opitutaceae bacterium]